MHVGSSVHGSPVIRRVARQRAASHVGGGPASIQVDGVDDSVALQEVSHLPETHAVQQERTTPPTVRQGDI